MQMKFSQLTARLQNLWLMRSAQERKALLIASLLVLLLLYIWVLKTGSTARKTLLDSVTVLRTEAATLEHQASELENLRVASPALKANVTLLAQMESAIAKAGFTNLMLSIEALGADQVTLAFGALPFSSWLAWVASLQEQKIQVSSAHLETLTTPGLVSITATFSRPPSP